MTVSRRSLAAGFLLAVAAAVATTVVRYLLRGILGDTFVFTLYVLPVMLAGWYGGLRPALLATVVSAFLSVTWVMPPLGRLQLETSEDVLRLGLFLFCGTVVSVLCESLHRAKSGRARAEDAGRAAMADLRRAEERLRTAMEGGNLRAFEWDIPAGRIRRLGEPGGETTLGPEFTLVDGMSMVHPEDREMLRERITAALAGDVPFFLAEFRTNDNPEREWCWHRTRAVVLREADGRPLTMSGVSMDITEPKRLEEALREADRRKDNYMAMLAHELRNPLAPIRNAVHLLKAEGSPSAHAAYSHEVIDRQSRHMSVLLDDLLNVSRIARGTLELRREQVGLRTVISGALETTQPVIEARGHRVEVRLPDREPVLHADPARLAQVFANLLTNAARYTPEGGRITVDAAVEGEHVVATVADNGIGIEPGQIHTIFEPFVQGAVPGHDYREGMGIGLALARSLVELHAGSLSAKSDGVGKGSRFIVRLPLGPAGERPAAGGPPPPAPNVEAWRIVIADDSRDNADSLAELLRIAGHEVATAYDGEEALAVAGEFGPRAVLLDLGMPRLDGYETCRRLRAMPSEQGLIIIALTGWGQPADRELTSAAGFDAHLVKPVDPEGVIALINRLGQNNPLPA